MIRSMTGFAESSAEIEDLKLWVRISSVNSRFLEFNIKLPQILSSFEPDVIKFATERVTRGRVNIFCWLEGKNKSIIYQPNLDRNLLIAYAEILEQAAGILWGEPRVNLGELVNLEIVSLKEKEEGKQILKTLLFESLKEAFKKFNETKSREGRVIAKEINSRLKKITLSIRKLYKLKQYQDKRLRDEWQNKLKEFLPNEIDPALLIKEASQLVMRKDFTEELVRFKSHIEFFRDSLKEPPPCGSRLNFILQEAMREITTLASKADENNIVRLAVFIKEELERIREQVQNVE